MRSHELLPEEPSAQGLVGAFRLVALRTMNFVVPGTRYRGG